MPILYGSLSGTTRSIMPQKCHYFTDRTQGPARDPQCRDSAINSRTGVRTSDQSCRCPVGLEDRTNKNCIKPVPTRQYHNIKIASTHLACVNARLVGTRRKRALLKCHAVTSALPACGRSQRFPRAAQERDTSCFATAELSTSAQPRC